MTLPNPLQAATKQSASQHFTAIEARFKLGNRVEARGNSCLVPAGTLGTVFRAERYRHDEYDLVVRWDRLTCRIGGRLQPVNEWFVRSEYEQRLREVGAIGPVQFRQFADACKQEALNVG